MEGYFLHSCSIFVASKKFSLGVESFATCLHAKGIYIIKQIPLKGKKNNIIIELVKETVERKDVRLSQVI